MIDWITISWSLWALSMALWPGQHRHNISRRWAIIDNGPCSYPLPWTRISAALLQKTPVITFSTFGVPPYCGPKNIHLLYWRTLRTSTSKWFPNISESFGTRTPKGHFCFGVSAPGSTPTSGRAVQQKVLRVGSIIIMAWTTLMPSEAVGGHNICWTQQLRPWLGVLKARLLTSLTSTSDGCNLRYVLSRSQALGHPGSTTGPLLRFCCLASCVGLENPQRTWARPHLQANCRHPGTVRGWAFLLLPFYSATNLSGQLCNGLCTSFCACREQGAATTQWSRHCMTLTWPHLFPECVARVPVSLGGLGVGLCSCSRSQPFAWVP